MDLSTVARAKARIEGISGTSQDTVLGELLDSVSKRAEVYLNRFTEVASRTAVFDLALGQRVVDLSAYPVTSVTSVKVDTSRAFTGDAMDSSLYYVDTDEGLVHFDAEQSSGRGICQVVWTGGMAADTTAFITAFPDIAQAVDEQVYFQWSRRKHVGVASQGSGGGSKAWATQDMLESFTQALDPHRRINL